MRHFVSLYFLVSSHVLLSLEGPKKVQLLGPSPEKVVSKVHRSSIIVHVPEHVLPSPVYPLRQRQTWDPSVLKHRALESQISFSHSLTSVLKDEEKVTISIIIIIALRFLEENRLLDRVISTPLT